MSHELSDGDWEFVGTLIDQLEDKTGDVVTMGAESIDPVTLCAHVAVISKIALLICSILQPAERE